MGNKKGRQLTPVIDNNLYSSLLFSVSNGNNYPKKIAESLNRDFGNVSRQLKLLEKKRFVFSKLEGDKKTFPFEKRVYSVNWKKIIEEFVKYLRHNVDYVCSENARLGMNLDKVMRGFNERVAQARDKNFENSLKENKLLYAFFETYYSTIGNLKESWTISSTFDFLSFFGDLNFLYSWGASHDFYNIEKLFYFLNNKKTITFPDWLKKEKKPETEAERYERFKKIHQHTTKEFEQLEKTNKEQMNDVIHKHKEVIDLFILSRILEVIKIKPSLQLGLNNAVKETGKKVFVQVFSKEQIKEYFDLRNQYHTFSSIQEGEQLQKDLKEVIGENDLEVTKPTENKHNKSGNTNQNKALSSENKQGESSE